MTSTEFIPPMLDGVSASKVFLPKMKPAPATVYQYLCQQFAHIEPAEWQQRFTDGLIYDALGQVLNLSSEYIDNSHVFYCRFLAHEIHVLLEHEMLFEDEHQLVIDKPRFLTICPT